MCLGQCATQAGIQPEAWPPVSRNSEESRGSPLPQLLENPFVHCCLHSPILLLTSRQGATLVISHIKVLPIFYGKHDVVPRTFRSHSFGQFSQGVNSRPPGTQSPSCRQISVVNTPLSNEAMGDEAALQMADPEYKKTMNPQLRHSLHLRRILAWGLQSALFHSIYSQYLKQLLTHGRHIRSIC